MFLTQSPGILALSPGVFAPTCSPGVEFLWLYSWISLGVVAPIAMHKDIIICIYNISPKQKNRLGDIVCPHMCLFFFTLATAPAPLRTCVAKVASMPLSCQTKTSAGNINQSPQENQTVPNRNGWLQAAREDKGRQIPKQTYQKRIMSEQISHTKFHRRRSSNTGEKKPRTLKKCQIPSVFRVFGLS